jgi:tetratricopeptide (TPR) repeat protein
MKQYDKAIDDFNAGIKLGDDSPDTYFDRSRAYRGLGKTDLAKADWETGITLDRKYGHCNEANAMATLEMLLFGGNQVTVVACK